MGSSSSRNNILKVEAMLAVSTRKATEWVDTDPEEQMHKNGSLGIDENTFNCCEEQ